MEGKVDSLADF